MKELKVLRIFVLLLITVVSYNTVSSQVRTVEQLWLKMIRDDGSMCVIKSNGEDSYSYLFPEKDNYYGATYRLKLNKSATDSLICMYDKFFISKSDSIYTVLSKLEDKSKRINKIGRNSIWGGISYNRKDYIDFKGLRWKILDSVNIHGEDYIRYSEEFIDMVRYIEGLSDITKKTGSVSHKYRWLSIYSDCDSSVIRSFKINVSDIEIECRYGESYLYKDDKRIILNSKENKRIIKYVYDFFVNKELMSLDKTHGFYLESADVGGKDAIEISVEFAGDVDGYTMRRYVIYEDLEKNKREFTPKFVEFLKYMAKLKSKYFVGYF